VIPEQFVQSAEPSDGCREWLDLLLI
jgi:hypothetical protein